MRVALLLFASLFAFALSTDCDWVQEPTSGTWFKCLNWYNSDTMTFGWSTYDQADLYCNAAGGRVLASIHSKEENDFIWNGVQCQQGFWGTRGVRNIGLRCVGATCKWRDGSPVDYTNFYGSGPPDDGATRCYTIEVGDNGQWKSRESPVYKDCGVNENGDSWICSKPPQAKCTEDETAHNNGCASVHLTPLDYKSASEACPGGGHLASIHSKGENNFYADLAVKAGLNGTVYLGGQYSQGAFEWTDGSYYDAIDQWASSFPNTIYGSCVQMLLSTDFYAQGLWSNVDCATKQPYMCFRDGQVYGPTLPTPANHTDPQCWGPNQHLSPTSGTIYSPNFPLSVPPRQGCEWTINTGAGTKATIRFINYDCKSGCTVSLYDGSSLVPFATFTTPSNVTYSAPSNVLGFEVDVSESPVGTGWEVQYYGA